MRSSRLRHHTGIRSSHPESYHVRRGVSSGSCGDLVGILNTEVGGANTPKHENGTEDPTGLVGILGGVATPSSGGDSLWIVDIATRRHRWGHSPLSGGRFLPYFFDSAR